MTALPLPPLHPSPAAEGRRRRYWLAAAIAVAAVLLLGLAALGGAGTASGLLAAALGALVAVILAAAAALALERQAAGAPAAPWQDTIDALPDALALVDRGGRLVAANRAFRSLVPDSGAAPLAALRRRLGDGDAQDGAVARLARAAAGGEAAQAASLAADRPWRLAARPLGDGLGHVLWHVAPEPAAATGVAPRPAAPAPVAAPIEAPTASEGRYRDLFEAAPVAVALLSGDGRVAAANRAWRAFFGEAETVGRAVAELVAPAQGARVAQWLRQIAAGAAPAEPFEATVEGREGDRAVSLFAAPVAGAEGRLSLVVHLHDATARRRLEREFDQGQKMQAMGLLAGGVAHDFNNILQAILNACELLLGRHGASDPSFADLMQVQQYATRAKRLVDQLLAFTRQQALQPRVLDATEVLSELSRMLRRLLGPKIELVLQHARGLGAIKVDQGQLEQVITNLALNARDAMPEGGRLTVRTQNRRLDAPLRRGNEEAPPGDYVALEVADNGSGIPPEVLPRIFEPFFTTKPVGAGTGLGLSTVYGIVRQTGGYVFVESAPGAGTTFTILLPRHGEAVAAPARETPEAPRRDLTGTGTVLIAEDEAGVRNFAARALRARGYTVLEADSGVRALELLEANPGVDLLVTDVMMPEMDGPTLLRKARALRPGLPAICVSGHAEEAFRQQLTEAADLVFLAKPFTLAELARVVKDALAERRAA